LIPLLTPDEVRAVDASADDPVEVLIERAGAAVAGEAIDLLGGVYGRRIVVVAGKGNNGNDGRSAARILRRRGARVDIVDASECPAVLPASDLVIDAAYGIGFRGTWDAPSPAGAPVLAVDIVSGVDAITGVAGDSVFHAERTVTFQGAKPGHVLGRGAELSGEVVIADIGLDASIARAWLVEDQDIGALLPARPRDTHKWRAAVWVIGGSPGMTGAASLAARAAQRAGGGYVRLSVPGGEAEDAPLEAVSTALPGSGWSAEVLDGAERFKAAIVGPGLGRGSDEDIRRFVADAPIPVVVDGDGLTALGRDVGSCVRPDTVLTPHDGEFERLTGKAPADDRLASVRELAASAGCTVLLKGPTTIVSNPDGEARLVTSGDARLASAGTGDVLSGVIGAFLAAGMLPLDAAACGAHVHGLAARLGAPVGLVAADVAENLPLVLAELG
jgi:NAD(P)H-hydrate epimerase